MAKIPKAKSKVKKAAAAAPTTEAPAAGEPYSTPEDKRKPGVKIWTPEDAQRALAAGKARTDNPEVDDALTPTPPGEGQPKQKLGPPPPRKKLPSLEEQAEARGKQVEAEQEAAALAIREGKEVGPPMPRARTLPKAEAETEVEIEVEALGPEVDPEMAKELAQQIREDVLAQEVVAELFQEFGFDVAESERLMAFYQKRQRVTLELQDGTFNMPAVVAVKSQFSITVLLPIDTNGTSFVPRPGTQLTLRLEEPGDGHKVYFPGAYCEIAPLKLAIMTFIRDQGDEDA